MVLVLNTDAAQSANSATTTLGTNVSRTVIGSQFNLRATTVNTLFGTNFIICYNNICRIRQWCKTNHPSHNQQNNFIKIKYVI